MTSFKARLNPITTFIFDVDGVLTTGDVILYSDEIIRILNSKDSYVMQLAIKLGYKIFIITGGSSQEVKNRLLELGVNEVYLKSSNKLAVYEDIKRAHKLSNEEILYMGDDIPDYEVLQKVGLATCPQDAAADIKRICHYQSPYLGGKGCVRDVIEQTLRVHEKWMGEGALYW